MHGFIVVDKPAGITSAGVVARLKRLLPRGTKVGHTGTLDPNVTGVLALAIGRATKAISYLAGEVKCYRCSMRFGIKTTTADIWGDQIETATVAPFSAAQIDAALSALTGKIEQLPPMFSAVKKDGKRLYELARAGQVVERCSKQIEVFGYSGIDYQFPNLTFTVNCSRGSYVRTLCEDIAAQLGTIATMTALRRLQSGPFLIADAVSLDGLTADDVAAKLLPPTLLFTGFAKITVDYKHAKHLTHGVKVNLARFVKPAEQIVENARYGVYYKGQFIGVARAAKANIKLEKLFIDSAQLEAYHDRI